MRADAQAQPNIALVKYWGKRNVDDTARNLPATGSLSVTLASLWTNMSVEFDDRASEDRLFVNGVDDRSMLPRVSCCLDRVAGADRSRAIVRSDSNFPIAAGLASSASAFAALVVAASKAANHSRSRLELARLAGASSGSAARSLFDGIVELRAGDADIDVGTIANADDWPLRIVIAITEERAKPVGSREAMNRCAATSPFYPAWLAHHDGDLQAAREAILQRDFSSLAKVAEHNCLKMHSLMWTSRPPIVYWNKATLACMETVRTLREMGHSVFFTIDAGPQVKAVCLPDAEGPVVRALSATAGVLQVLTSGLGAGARLLDAPLDAP